MSEICASCGDEFNSMDGSEELCPNCQEVESDSPPDGLGGSNDDDGDFSDEY